MRVLVGLIRLISGINWLIGNVFAWLSLAIVLVCFTVVVQRYVFATTQLWMQDLYVWMNGAMFTPTTLDLARVAALFNLPHRCIEALAQLPDAFAASSTLIEIPVRLQ